MKRSSTKKIHRFANSKALHLAVFAIAMISFTLNGCNAKAANVILTDYRLATANDKFDDTRQLGVAFKMRPRRRLRAKRLEQAMGTLSTSQENRQFVSLGPMQRPLVIHEQNAVAGLTNRLLARPARAVLQAFPGSFPANIKTEAVGLSSTNPGMNMIGIDMAFTFSNRLMNRTGESS